ncbi:MAG: hypothetical protein ABSB71_06395 [Candidatus Bathyarchaeia archaeon]
MNYILMASTVLGDSIVATNAVAFVWTKKLTSSELDSGHYRCGNRVHYTTVGSIIATIDF